MIYKNVLFDLDGTVTDPYVGITSSILHSLKYYPHIKAPERECLKPFIGPPLYASYMKYFGMDEKTAHEAVEHYREYYAVKGKFENELYGGIKELLSDEGNEVLRLGLINVILGNVMNSIFFENSETANDMELSSRILSYVNQHFKDDIDLDTLAHEFGYNKSYLSRYFKSAFNVGFNQYLSTVRLKNSLILMNEKKHSLTHCALEGGFNSMRTFYRVFENEFNCSPKEYLKNIESYNKAEKVLKK